MPFPEASDRLQFPARPQAWENATMAPSEILDADVFADPDAGSACTAARQSWTIPAGEPVASGNDGGLGALAARAAATRAPVDPGRHISGRRFAVAGASPTPRDDGLADFIGTIYSA